jgi:hypothetical protein
LEEGSGLSAVVFPVEEEPGYREGENRRCIDDRVDLGGPGDLVWDYYNAPTYFITPWYAR